MWTLIRPDRKHGFLRRHAGAVGLVSLALAGLAAAGLAPSRKEVRLPEYVVFAYNELGMHCMQQDFSEMMILPPFNNLKAQVIRKGDSPDIVSPTDATVSYVIPANTHSVDKCNFWTHSHALLGADLPPDVGLGGFGLSGNMTGVTGRQFQATGIPITPVDDSGRENPYPLALVTAQIHDGGTAKTQAVVPVSWEMSCNLCHNTPGISVATDILRAHDRRHGTTLEQSKPVFCASCHADPAVGSPGQPGRASLSSAMHSAHAPRMAAAHLDNECYACHPGFRTQCLRDVHSTAGMTCNDCHTGGMVAIGNPARTPWVDEPKCSDCHNRPGYQYEEPGKLFKQSAGHMGVACMACHGSPHAITPTGTAADNLQAITKQGHAGVINTCTVCHITTPGDPFPHRRND